ASSRNGGNSRDLGVTDPSLLPHGRFTTCFGPSPYSVFVKTNFRTIYRNGNTDCDVLVVGAGPTGLTLATALAARGVDVTIVDRLAEGANTSRAAVVHARSLEVLEQIGVADRLNARGLKCRTFSIRDRDRTLLSLDFGQLPTRYPYTLMVSQAETESVLLERLRESGGHLIRPRVLTGLEQNAFHADASFDDGTK